MSFDQQPGLGCCLYRTPVDGKGKGGNLVYVVYNDKGEEIEEIGEIAPGSEYENSYLMSVTEFNQYIDQYDQQMQSFADFY
ncbi:MAG: hypothetical protein P8X79_21010, partial [Reinekea sp.]